MNDLVIHFDLACSCSRLLDQVWRYPVSLQPPEVPLYWTKLGGDYSKYLSIVLFSLGSLKRGVQICYWTYFFRDQSRKCLLEHSRIILR